MKYSHLIAIFATFAVMVGSCQPLKKVFTGETAREKYETQVKKGPLAQKPIVQNWLAAGDSILAQPVNTEIPIQAKMVYFNDEPNTWAWQFNAQEGRTLRAHLAVQDTSHQLFMELFSIENGTPIFEKSLDDSLLSYTLDEDQTLILRIQAELLIDGSAILTITDNPSMEFPVQGGIRADIGSFWGDPRDGGSRQHEGVDIFADRGTPVVATADGRVTRTGNRGLGGRQVWLRANGKSMYYAHLDSINSGMLEGVQKGDTLGFVGNSGNARTTPTHLHFGIYDGGAINPLPFINFANTQVEPITADPTGFSKWGRVDAAKANVRPLPSTEQAPFASLSRNNIVQITGGVGEWYQVSLPERQKGFIYHTLVEPASAAIDAQNLTASDSLFYAFADNRPFVQVDSSETINIFGTYQNRALAKYYNHWVWVNDE